MDILPSEPSENLYFLEFINTCHLSYQSPSHYILSCTIINADAVLVHLEDVAQLSEHK